MDNKLSQKFEEKNNRLNIAQKKAVDEIDGPVMVVAGPGTGKTTVLTLRIANLLNKTDTAPESILALTYTTSGVISMRENLIKIIGDRAYRVNIFTFHAFCEHLMKEFSFYFEKLEESRVVDDLERVEIIESIISQNRFEHLVSFHDEYSFLNKIVSGILAIKKEGLSPQEFIERLPLWEKDLFLDDDVYYKKDYGKYKKGEIKPAEREKIEKKIEKAKELGHIFSLYQVELEKRGLYDFSDMILYVKKELRDNKDFKADVGEKYQYILVDEHQDTNEGQNILIELLTDAPHLERRPNVFTVGDEKQSIYRFQGASKETFSRFNNLYKDVEIINLEENYRSTANILDGSHSLIIKSKGLEDSVLLHSNRKENEKIDVLEFSSYKFELLYLAEDIKKKIDDGVSPSEIAVLYRVNKNVSDIKTIFDYHKIPYTIFSKDKILDDPNIRNLINILRVVNDLNDDHSLGKILFVNFLSIDVYDAVLVLDKLKYQPKDNRKHLFAFIEDEKLLRDIGVKNTESFVNLANILKDIKKESQNNDFPDFFKIFLNKINYIKYMINSVDGQSQLAKLDKFIDEIKRQNSTRESYSLSDFVYFIDSFIKYNLDIKSNDPEIIEGVSLMTAHGSKGREFEHVYIINATRKSWESRKGAMGGISLPIYQYDGDKEDERRLFYVAMTRAKDKLTISYSRIDNDGAIHEESQFVKEIEPDFKDEKKMKAFEEKNLDKISSFMSAERKTESLFDKKYLTQLFYNRGLNVSALNNYLDCPRKYLYKNLIRIPDVYSLTLNFGNMIHKTLELFFQNCKREEKILPKKDLIKEFEKQVYLSNMNDKDEEKFKKRGITILGEYYDRYKESWTYNVKVEFNPKKNFTLDNGETLELSGKIDKIEYVKDESSGEINIIDYKTGKPFSEKSKEQKLDYERQIIFYHLLLEDYDNGGLKINKSVLDFLDKNKKGEFEQYSFDVANEDIDKLKKEINDFAEEILSMKFLEKGCNKRDCEWCQMK